MRLGHKSAKAGAIAWGIACGCEAHGLVGSNATATQGAPYGDAAGGLAESGAGGAASTTADTGDAVGETSDFRFDLAWPDLPTVCGVTPAEPCDSLSDDPLNALGINCGAEAVVQGEFRGDPLAFTVHRGKLGTSGIYAPREGERFVVLSTGDARDLSTAPTFAEVATNGCFGSGCPSTEHSDDVLSELPPPIDTRPVSSYGGDCGDNPSLIGAGDCSNTLQAAFADSGGARDYAEFRIVADVPVGVDALSYEFAFFTVEYPPRAGHERAVSDLHFAWLESEAWTGNIARDEHGQPISARDVNLDYKDAPSGSCHAPCEAPQLRGFAMEGHAGTRWLRTTAPVVAGETITLVFAIYDATDSAYDSMTALDNFEWICGSAPPATVPVG